MTPSPGDSMIHIEGLSKTFRRQKVLDAIHLEVPKGQRIALIGANGAGKTTLFRCLLGEYVFEGDIHVEGKSPRLNRREVLSKIGFVPQLPPPLKMPVAQLIAFAAGLCESDPEKIYSICTHLGLNAKIISAKPFFRLSGGMQQKLLIAIALGREASVLIMDEPAANLDPDARKAFFALLADRLNNTTMIISSHRLDEVAALVNRVVEIDQGKVVYDHLLNDTAEIGKKLKIRVVLKHTEESVSRLLQEWQLSADASKCHWQGEIPAPDRLRFLGLMTRYSALIAEIHLEGDTA